MHDYFFNNKNNILFIFNYLRDQTSKTVRQLWVQRLNVLMQLFENGFFIACRSRCSLVHHSIFFKWLRNERDMDETLTMCFLS